MIRINHKGAGIALSCLLLFACSKKHSDVTMTTAPGPLVYVAGDDGANPILWKDGTPQTLLTTGGTASQVVLSGEDTYVSGISYQGQATLLTPAGPTGQFCYWKNGSQVNVGTPDFLRTPCCSMAIVGNDVYYTAESTLYKNGSAVTLPGEGSGYLCSVLASGNDIYVAGRDSAGNAAYWKNGALTVVAGGFPNVFCAYVSGNDVYLGGLDGNNISTYWKNGVATQLKSTNGYFVAGVRSLFVAGNDVYAATTVLEPSGYPAPAYWKNGVETDLFLNGSNTGFANSIFVFGTDVYVAGQTVAGQSAAGAVYWKNGNLTVLNSKGEANWIYVQ